MSGLSAGSSGFRRASRPRAAAGKTALHDVLRPADSCFSGGAVATRSSLIGTSEPGRKKDSVSLFACRSEYTESNPCERM